MTCECGCEEIRDCCEESLLKAQNIKRSPHRRQQTCRKLGQHFLDAYEYLISFQTGSPAVPANQISVHVYVRACVLACVHWWTKSTVNPLTQNISKAYFWAIRFTSEKLAVQGAVKKKNRTKHFLPVKASCVLLVTKINDCTSTSMQGVIGGKALTASGIRTNQNISGHKSAAGQEVRSSFKASGETMRAFHSCATLIPSKLCMTALNPVSCCGSEPGGGKAKALAVC